MRNEAINDTIALLLRLGWSFTGDQVKAFVDHLEARGFIRNEMGMIISPSGETLGSALATYWDEPAPNKATEPATEADDRAKYDGLTKAEFDKLSSWDRAAIESKVQGPPQNESWRKRVAPVPMRPGDEKLSPEEKLARANEATFRQMGVIQ